jgi:FkbM family methyltransferase
LEAIFGRSLLMRAGRYLYLGSRRELVNDPEVNGEYALMRWCMTALKSSPNLAHFDIGANLGDWSVQLLKLLPKDHHVVHAFEPAPEQFLSIEKRCSAEVANGQLKIHQLAIADRVGTTSFTLTGGQTGNSAISNEHSDLAGEAITVTLATLNQFVQDHQIDQIGLVKVDTEGNDFNVILGAQDMLAKGRIAVLQFEYNWRWVAFGHMLHSVFKLAAPTPYKLVRLTPSCLEVYDVWHPELERFFETNFALVRQDFIDKMPHQYVSFDLTNTPILL